jgi:hypothetical protein
MDVAFLDESRFAWAQYTGLWSIGDICGSVEGLLAGCLARRQRLLLIDWSQLESRRISTLERYQLAASSLTLLEKLDKVATVTSTDMIDPEKFGERVAQNRGLNVRVFPKVEAAQRWLLEGGR